jgi:tryptophanyl-tRNA synthetase
MAITDPARIRATDKGHPDICSIYRYHQAFNIAEAPQIEEHCRQGKIGCVACKNELAERLNGFLNPIREKRSCYEASPAIIKKAVQDGNTRARAEATETMRLVREAMHFDYRELVGGDAIVAR